MHLHVDGIPGEETLMQLMRVTNSTPGVLIQATRTTPDAKCRRRKPNVDHLPCGPAQLYNRGSGLVFVPPPQPENVFGKTALWLVGLCAMLVVGLYMHVYWNLRHPAPEPVNASVAKPETQLSEMHYVYVSKPFPHPQPKVAPVHVDVPPMQDLPISSDDADWQQAPEGAVPHDTSRDTLPGTEAHEHDIAPPARAVKSHH